MLLSYVHPSETLTQRPISGVIPVRHNAQLTKLVFLTLYSLNSSSICQGPYFLGRNCAMVLKEVVEYKPGTTSKGYAHQLEWI